MFLLAGSAGAQEARKPGHVFRSDDVLEVTITAPIRTLMRKRPDDIDLPGKISYLDATGATVEIDVGLRTRGHYRRQMRVCPFAPIRLNFDKSQTKGTLFRKQDKMKLVTHCRNGSSRYKQLVLKEYLVYRIMNHLSDFSFRVRLLRITYVDSDDPRYRLVSYGFLIEHKTRLAKRLGLTNIEVKSTNDAALLGDYTNLTSMFHFFVANTDFSPVAGEPDEDCCHNSVLFGRPALPYYPIPYDFDMAGMTDAPYATPNPKFKIRNVRQRLYRGRCINNAHLPASLQVFQDNKDAFFILVQNLPNLSGSSKSSMFSLMQSFYKLIEDPKAVEKKLVRRCV
jgi:hypothetical protein